MPLSITLPTLLIFALTTLAPESEAQPPGRGESSSTATSPLPPKTMPPQGSGLNPYSDWAVRLAAAIDATNDRPEHAPNLALLLSEAPTFTEALGDDAAGRRRRNDGLLTLARAYLVGGDKSRAAETMDDALRSAGSDRLDAERYGPSLAALHRTRKAELTGAGNATIKIDCATPCRVFINEHPAPAYSRNLLIGAYRVRIVSSTGAHPPGDEVVIAEAGQVHHITFPLAPEGPALLSVKPASPPVSDTNDTKRHPRSQHSGRTLPRWVEITAVVGGTALAGAGTFLLLAEDRCIGDVQALPTAAAPAGCPNVYGGRTLGIAMIGAGAAVVAGGVLTLSIDESRLRRRPRTDAAVPVQRFMIGYSRRF